MTNLFDFGNGGLGTGTVVLGDFLSKIENIKKDYTLVLGEETVDFVSNLVVEYNSLKQFHERMSEEYTAEYERLKNNKSFKEDSDHSYLKEYFICESLGIDKHTNVVYNLQTKIDSIFAKCVGVIETHINKKWKIKVDVFSELKDKKLNEEIIFESILRATKDGDFEATKETQIMNDVKTLLLKGWDCEILKTKIVFERFSFTEKCRFMKRWESRSNYEKCTALCESLRHCFDICEEEVRRIKKHLDLRNEEVGAFEEYKPTSNVIEKIKLLKNGKLEITFKNKEDASKYFDAYIKPNK